jgi:hypothetical protein
MRLCTPGGCNLAGMDAFTNYIRVRFPARYFKVMAIKAVLKKIPHNVYFLLFI